MTAPTEDIHSCSYFCTRPACVLAQRDEMRAELARLREQEPVAYCNGDALLSFKCGNELPLKLSETRDGFYKTPLYAAPPAQPAINAEDRCKRTLIELDARLRECSIVGASAADAYDTFYQDMVAEALAAQPMYAGDIHRSMAAEIRLLREQLAQQEPVAWINVADRMPESGKTVLAYHKNSAGHARRIRAMWVAAKSHESGPDSEIGEYDEDDDCYYDPQGWYERIEHWVDYTAVAVCGVEITHWMPMPAPPIAAAQKAQP